MRFFQLYQKDFFWTIALGSGLVLLILLLGVSFFRALNTTQIESRRDFLKKQTELAAIDLEIEVDRFIDYANSLNDYLDDSDLDEEDYNEHFTNSSRRVFNNYLGLIDTLVVDFEDSVIFMTQTPRNDFIRREYDQRVEDFEKSDYLYRIEGIEKGIKLYFKLNPVAYSKYFVKNYYLDRLGNKLLYLDDSLFNINHGSDLPDLKIDPAAYKKIAKDIERKVFSTYEIKWTYFDIERRGIIVQYPVRFGNVISDSSLLFLIELDSVTAGIYSNYFLLFLGLVVLIFGIVILFTYFLRNRIESERLLLDRSNEISSLFDQQNLLLKELRGFVYFHDNKGKITRVSDEISEVLGVSQERFLTAFNENSGQKDVGKVRDLIKKAIRDKVSYIDFEYDFETLTGKKIHLRVFEKLLIGQNGHFMGGIGICTDNTSQHMTQMDLIQSEKRLRTLMENIPDYIFIYDNSGVIIDFQVQVEEILIGPSTKLIGSNFTGIILKSQVDHIQKAFIKARNTGIMQSVDMKARVNSEEKYYSVRIFPLDENKMMSISTDITSQRIWEKGLLEAMNDADQANKAKSEFLANMSHEIRTPLNGLLGIIDLLEQTKLDNIQNEYLDVVKDSGNSLLKIVKDILDYSKIESGKIEIHSTPFVPEDQLKKHIQILSGLAKKRNILLTSTFSERTNTPFEGDIDKIKQVFLNLLGNALKFTPENGKVFVSVEIESITSELVFLKISVKDTGIGISEELIPHLTEPFFQVDSSDTRAFHGTGLGLAISKKIVELLGGQLEIKSIQGQGSEFSFSTVLKVCTSPIIKQKFAAEQKSVNWNGMARDFPLRILLAEDNDLNIKLMNLMLDQLGYECDIAKDGREAVEKTLVNKYDLVLMDVQMPIMNGLEASKTIRTIPHNEKLFLVGLSANVFDEDQKKAIDSGMDDYITKPIRLHSLAEKLKFYSKKVNL
jgi:PAS domain S-box-containing protein